MTFQLNGETIITIEQGKNVQFLNWLECNVSNQTDLVVARLEFI